MLASAKSEFRPTKGQAALDLTGAIDPEWTPVTPEVSAKHFAELPEGAQVRQRVYRQLGAVFAVEAGGTTTRYILSHGDPDFPEGKAVVKE